MTERSYQDAVQILKDRLGGRWEGSAADGRDEMARILKDQLGYTDKQADDTIDAMIDSGTLRYQEADAANQVAGAPVPPAMPASPVGTGSSTPMIAPVAGALGGGYWQIGEGVSEAAGRKGQVDPT
jgi:hypothetical protein